MERDGNGSVEIALVRKCASYIAMIPRADEFGTHFSRGGGKHHSWQRQISRNTSCPESTTTALATQRTCGGACKHNAMWTTSGGGVMIGRRTFGATTY